MSTDRDPLVRACLIVASALIVFTGILIADRFDHPSRLEADCDSHRSLIYRQDGKVLRIVEFHPDCRP